MNDTTEDERIVRPGDTLVIRVRAGTTATQVEYAKNQIGPVLPEGVRLVFLAAEQILVVRPGESVSE